ncbi:hypothetical protein CBS101457_006707 [Exobasidium rhododendri]|nr:hypothetical protein CBS101457_006707 [Exobasidium rhododendri]
MASKGVRVTSSSQGSLVATGWHVLALGVFTYAFQSLDEIAKLSGTDIEAMFGGHYQFLTILGLWVSRLGMGLALISDVMPSNNLLRKTKAMVCVAALPTETLISILYWSIMTISPDLLVPPLRVVDPDNPAQFIMKTVRIPLLADLSMHAAPAIFLLVDYLVFSPPFPKSIRPTLISASVTISYCVWAEVCAYNNGNYPYPLLEVLSAPARLALYVACAAIFVGVLGVVRLLHGLIDQAWSRSWGELDGQEGKGVVGEIDKRK